MGRNATTVMYFIRFLLLIVSMPGLTFPSAPVAAKVWHVCMHCPDRDVQSIGEALKRAEPHDTILVYWESEFPYYMEHLIIDKPVRIISNVAAGDITDYDLYPVITSQSRELVHITVPGVEFIGFNLMYLQKPSACEDNSTCYADSVGLRLDAPASIRQCAITNCSTGILAAYQIPGLKTGSVIQQCRIGIPPDHGVNADGLNETRNHFGIVLLGYRQKSPEPGTGKDMIRDCQIIRNTQYGIVYTPASEPDLVGNVIEFNGVAPFRMIRPDLDQRNGFVWLTPDAGSSLKNQ